MSPVCRTEQRTCEGRSQPPPQWCLNAPAWLSLSVSPQPCPAGLGRAPCMGNDDVRPLLGYPHFVPWALENLCPRVRRGLRGEISPGAGSLCGTRALGSARQLDSALARKIPETDQEQASGSCPVVQDRPSGHSWRQEQTRTHTLVSLTMTVTGTVSNVNRSRPHTPGLASEERVRLGGATLQTEAMRGGWQEAGVPVQHRVPVSMPGPAQPRRSPSAIPHPGLWGTAKPFRMCRDPQTL